MKFTEINTRFTEKVTLLIYDGYMINAQTMNGSQGEIAHIDLRKGDDLIRVMLTRETFFSYKDGISGNLVRLTVGRCSDPAALRAKTPSDYATIWNCQLKIIETIDFWQMEDADWYIEGDAGKEARKLAGSREKNGCEIRVMNEWKSVMLPSIRRKLGKKRFPLENVTMLYKTINEGRSEYCANTTAGIVRFS